MKNYIVMAKFKESATSDKISELIPLEQKLASALKDKGSIGGIRVAMPRKTVFIEAFGTDDKQVRADIETLPMAKLWNIEIYEVTPPAGSILN